MSIEKVQIEGDSNESTGFYVDSEIIDGLYSTTDTTKVTQNIKTFNIEIQTLSQNVATKISKRNNFAIITILIDDSNKFQYLVSHKFNPSELTSLNSQELPESIKAIVLEAYKLTQTNTLGDLFK